MSMASHEKSTLNDLIATTFDSIDGYLDAAKNSESDRLVALFDQRVIERRAVIDLLRREVIKLGGKPQDDGSLSASAHRMFFNLKSAVTGRDEQAIVDEVEKGEDHITAKFEDAMADTELSPGVLRTIRECHASIRQGHDQMRELKQTMPADQTPSA